MQQKQTREKAHLSGSQTAAMSSAAQRLLRSALRMAGILLAGILLGYVLLALTYLIPEEAMQAKLLETIQVFDESSGRAERMDQTLVQGYPSTWLDNTSDSFFLQCAAARLDGVSIWKQAAHNPYYSTYEQSAAGEELIHYVKKDSDSLILKSMGRYWNGYLIFLKPMLTWMSYQDIRMLNMVALGVCLMAMVMLMYRRGMQRYLPAFGAAFLSLTPMVLPLNMHYSVVVYLALGGMLVMLAWPEWVEKRLGSTALFLVLGMATAYFDMLTYPLLSFGFPAVVWLLLSRKEGEKKALQTLVRIGLAWLAGYAVMWAGKWVVMALIGYTKDAMAALNSIVVRSGAEEFSRQSTIVKNVRMLWRKPFKVLVCAGTIAVVAVVLKACLRDKKRFAPPAAMLVISLVGIAVLPLAWYYLLANTNHTHAFFMHRSLSISVFAGLALLTRLLRRSDGQTIFRSDDAGIR